MVSVPRTSCRALYDIDDSVIREMIDEEDVVQFRARAMSPDRPVTRGTSQNPDVYFQARESVNPFYQAMPDIVQQTMDKFAELTGRQYRLFDYVGAEDAEQVILLMGSGAEAADETVESLLEAGEKVGIIKIRLYRPFDCATPAKTNSQDLPGYCRTGSNQGTWCRR